MCQGVSLPLLDASDPRGLSDYEPIRDSDFKCTGGGMGNGDMLIAVNGQGNSRGRPAGSGWYLVTLDEDARPRRLVRTGASSTQRVTPPPAASRCWTRRTTSS